MESDISIAKVVFFIALGVALPVTAFLWWRKAMSEYREYELWRRRQLEMALEQMKSSDEDEILRGLHTVFALADSSTSAQALSKVVELRQSHSRSVAKPAEVAYEHMLEVLSESPQR